jgi:hypothetical protein
VAATAGHQPTQHCQQQLEDHQQQHQLLHHVLLMVALQAKAARVPLLQVAAAAAVMQ